MHHLYNTMIHRGPSVEVALPHFSSNTSVLKLLLEALKRNGNGLAQVEGQTDRAASFADILQQSSSIAAGLHSAGVSVGEVVVFCCDKSILAFSLLLGTMLTGATAALISTKGAGEIHKLTKGQRVKAVFCDMVYEASVKQSVISMSSPPALVATLDTVATSLMKPVQDFTVFNAKDVKKHIPLILFTSGSTGDPKGVQLSDFAVQGLGYSYEDGSIKSFLVMSTFGWLTTIISLISSILKGYTLVFSNSAEPRDNMLLIQKYKVNGWMMSSSSMTRYIHQCSLCHVDLSSLTLMIIGGEVMMKRVIKTFINTVLGGRIGVRAIYGLTETGALTVWRDRNLLDLSKANAAGYLGSGVEMKILDESGNQVTNDCIGEVWVKSLGLMLGYWGRPELNRELFDSDGFFRTGDAGYFDSEGFLYLRGRIKDIVSIKGITVSMSDVEDILKSHPAVLEVAVVAKPHPVDLNQLVAFVVKKPGANTNEQEIVSFVADQVEDHLQIRGGVRFIDILPRTSSNKIQRILLQKMIS